MHFCRLKTSTALVRTSAHILQFPTTSSFASSFPQKSQIIPSAVSHFHMSQEPVDIESACVHRIQRMRNEVDIFNKGRGNSYGPISHALENLPGFSLSLSDWSEHHLCRFQVVINGQTDEALFPNEYVVSDNDKTLKAITEDGFFRLNRERFRDSRFEWEVAQRIFHGSAATFG